jgi:putative addiction module component (TIGR02574 family)
MRVREIPQFYELSTAEKILLVEEMWDHIAAEDSALSVPESHKAELDARLAAYEANPDDTISLDELKKRIDSRK